MGCPAHGEKWVTPKTVRTPATRCRPTTAWIGAVNDRRYRDTIKDDLRSIPTLSLVIDPEDLWSEENNGIYAFPLQEGDQWERPVSAELYGTDGQLEFQIDAGVRIHGGWGRRPSQTNKHSMRLLFKSEYGAAKLEYPWFGEDAAQEFDTIVLRANFNHSWAAGGDTLASFVQDPWASQTQLDMGWPASHGTFVHLYLNGLYWGLYNPVERPTETFAAAYFGGDKDEYDVNATGTATSGDSRAWSNLTRLVSARKVDYAAVQDVLDIDAFIDYLIINQYGGNWDWPQNNWYAMRRRVDGGKWYFHSWDAEGMLASLSENRVTQYGGMGVIYQNLRDKVEEFRVRFSDRIQKHFFNDGLLTPEANIVRLNGLAAQIDRAVVGESARWGDSRWDEASPPRTRDTWLQRLEDLREDYFPRRGDVVLKQYRQVDLFPEMDAPRLNRHGGPVQSGFELTIDNPGGARAVYYTLNGTDPRVAGGAVAPEAIVYDGSPIVISGDVHVMVRIRQDDEWSALTEADFLVGGLRVTEVNYHPHDPNPLPGMNEPAGSSDQFEFVELANVGAGRGPDRRALWGRHPVCFSRRHDAGPRPACGRGEGPAGVRLALRHDQHHRGSVYGRPGGFWRAG